MSQARVPQASAVLVAAAEDAKAGRAAAEGWAPKVLQVEDHCEHPFAGGAVVVVANGQAFVATAAVVAIDACSCLLEGVPERDSDKAVLVVEVGLPW